jgi:hypothetical protein
MNRKRVEAGLPGWPATKLEKPGDGREHQAFTARGTERRPTPDLLIALRADAYGREDQERERDGTEERPEDEPHDWLALTPERKPARDRPEYERQYRQNR